MAVTAVRAVTTCSRPWQSQRLTSHAAAGSLSNVVCCIWCGVAGFPLPPLLAHTRPTFARPCAPVRRSTGTGPRVSGHDGVYSQGRDSFRSRPSRRAALQHRCRADSRSRKPPDAAAAHTPSPTASCNPAPLSFALLSLTHAVRLARQCDLPSPTRPTPCRHGRPTPLPQDSGLDPRRAPAFSSDRQQLRHIVTESRQRIAPSVYLSWQV